MFGLDLKKVVIRRPKKSVRRQRLSLWCNGMPSWDQDIVELYKPYLRVKSLDSSTWTMLTKRRVSVQIQNRPNVMLGTKKILEPTQRAII